MGFDFSKVPWREPWHAIRLEHRAMFEKQLCKEVARGHPLFEKPVVAVGRRQDCDDVLFYLGDAAPQVVVVHLTHPHEVNRTNPNWPSTKFFGSVGGWIHDGLNRDADDFENG